MDQPTRENETEEFVGQIHRLLQSGEEKQTYEEAVRLLQGLLTPAVCRRLGLYPFPDDFLLSVVIPIYNEAQTLRTLVELSLIHI